MSGYNQSWKSRNVSNIPNMLLCKLCDHRKPREQFSKNELNSFNPRKPSDLRCMACTSVNQRQELECERCSKVKDLSKFSKSSRKNGGNKWCIECTNFKGAAAPVQVDVDDLHEVDWNIAAAADSFSHMSVASISSTVTNSVIGGGSAINFGRPSHVTNSLTFGQGNNAPRANAGAGYIPPHLRNTTASYPTTSDEDTKSYSSMSNAFTGDDTTSEKTGGWKPRGIHAQRHQFTGYAPDGMAHDRIAYQSTTEGERKPPSASNSTSVVAETRQVSFHHGATVRSGGWAKAVGKKIESQHGTDAEFPCAPEVDYDSDDRDWA